MRGAKSESDLTDRGSTDRSTPRKDGGRKVPKIKPPPPHQHRMCVVCRGIAPKDELLRLRVVDRVLVADELQRGRGCYVHETVECLSKLKDRGRIEHAFRAGQTGKSGRTGRKVKRSAGGESVARQEGKNSAALKDFSCIESLLSKLRERGDRL